ncbi:MAG TPA: hypothetical protein VII95_18360 [Terriglobales bacterium]|jgi:hypothetical protein
MMKFAVIAFMTLIFAVPAFSKAHKDSYPQPCSELWTAVKDTLSNPDNYTVEGTPDDAKMTASYNVKHAVHASITGAVMQRTNQITLISKGTGCEMQVVSSFSGLAHDDAGDFKKRVEESLAKGNTKPVDAAKPGDATK